MPQVSGREVGPIGFGLIPIIARHPRPTEEETFATLRAAIESGCTLWDAGEFYARPDDPGYTSLKVLERYFAKYPEDAAKVLLNVKGGVGPKFTVDGSPAFVRQSVDNCVRQLGGRIPIHQFECARRDPNTPHEVTLGALNELVREGKIDGVALSEVNAATIREAAKTTAIQAVEVELSLWCTGPLTNGIAATCKELGVPLYAYSPLGRGMLTGTLKSLDDLPAQDHRRMHPRFQPGTFEQNRKLVTQVEALATRKGCTPSQIALGWLRALSKRADMPEIIPIPGSSSPTRVIQNATVVELTQADMDELSALIDAHEIVGNRYPDAFMAYCDL